MLNWSEQVVLITGGAGSFGQKFAELLLRHHNPAKIVVFSRDELKHHTMRAAGFDDSKLQYLIGDVRDREALERAFQGVTAVLHAAALKQIPACEANPLEAIQTNILGGQNVLDAALRQGVQRILTLSTDKAVRPVNTYGATKLCAEKLFVHANAYAGTRHSCFSCIRFGNLLGSTGSVVPVFLEQRKQGKITITDPRMTRFWIGLEKAARFAIRCIENMQGGEIFVPKSPSMRLVEIAEMLGTGCEIEVVGRRPGEKLHEVLLSDDEAERTLETDEMYIVQPNYPYWNNQNWRHAIPVQADFEYTSEANEHWLSGNELEEIVFADSDSLRSPTIVNGSDPRPASTREFRRGVPEQTE